MFNRKPLAVILAFVIAISAVGCTTAGNEKSSQTYESAGQTTIASATMQTEVTSSVVDPAEPDKCYVTINGTNLRAGMKFSDVKNALGAPKSERQIVDEGGAFGGDYYNLIEYEDFEITTDPKDIIRIIDVTGKTGIGSSITIGGKIKLGDSFDVVRAFLGTPTTEEKDEDMDFKVYQFEKCTLVFYVTDNSINRITIGC